MLMLHSHKQFYLYSLAMFRTHLGDMASQDQFFRYIVGVGSLISPVRDITPTKQVIFLPISH